MSSYDLDLFVIGAGSGGVRAARTAAATGARVAVAEERHLGGTCVNVGCVPKKLLVYASSFHDLLEDAAGYGWTVGERGFDWKRLLANKNREIERLNGVYRRMLEGAGVRIVEGRARLVDPHTVVVGERRFTAGHVLVATGGRPHVPALPGADLAVTSDDAFFLDELPRRVAIVGGGYIAVEFAGILHRLGVDVTLLYRGPLFLRGFDDDVRGTLADEMRRDGVELRFRARPTAIESCPEGGYAVLLDDGGEVGADLVLCAVGRLPNTAGIGLDEIGVELDARGAVVVDDHSRSTVPSVWAVGDCTDRRALTPVALAEATAFVRTVFEGRPTAMDYSFIPSAVFSQPPVATVGLTESEASDRCREVRVFRSTFRPMQHALSGRDTTTMMKLVVDADTDVVMGLHMVGPDAAEIVQGFAVALKAGATKATFDATLGIHPTAAEEFVTMRSPVG